MQYAGQTVVAANSLVTGRIMSHAAIAKWRRAAKISQSGEHHNRRRCGSIPETDRKAALDRVGEYIGQFACENGVLHRVPPRGAQQVCMVIFEQCHIAGIGKEKGRKGLGKNIVLPYGIPGAV